MKPSSLATASRSSVIGHAGQRARCPAAARRHASAAFGEALIVPLQHLEVGQQVMGQQHRLGHLDVRVAGQDGVLVGLGLVEQGLLQAPDSA